MSDYTELRRLAQSADSSRLPTVRLDTTQVTSLLDDFDEMRDQVESLTQALGRMRGNGCPAPAVEPKDAEATALLKQVEDLLSQGKLRMKLTPVASFDVSLEVVP